MFRIAVNGEGLSTMSTSGPLQVPPLPVPDGELQVTDPEEIADTLHDLARLDPVEVGLETVLDRIVRAAVACCGVTGGVGLLLLDSADELRHVVAAGRPLRSLGGMQVRLREGPSMDAFQRDEPVDSGDLTAEPRWPAFGPVAVAAGVRAWLAVPVHRRYGPIGTLDFARTEPQPWRPQDLAAGNAYARLIVSTLELAMAHGEEGLASELRFALDHDARIEQARGVVMEREQVDEPSAFELLRQQAYIEGQPMRAIAERILARARR